MKKQKITDEEVKRCWELWREYYLTPADYAFLSGANRGSIYKAITEERLATEKIDGQKMVIINHFFNLEWLVQAMNRRLESIDQFIIDESGQRQFDRNYLEYEALTQTVSRMVQNMRIDFQESQRTTVAELTDFEIIQKKFLAVIELIHAGEIDIDRVKKLLETSPEKIAVHKAVVNCEREAACGMLNYKK